MSWRPAEISLRYEDADFPVVVAEIGTPAGVVTVLAEVVERGQTLILRGLHLQGLSPNEIGAANLRLIARVVMEETGYDAIEIEGAARTTGANPGRRPRVLRFTRYTGVAGSGR
jgi:hypothetical protein